ncbi:MAG: sulfatase-like hydrolase/transferase [Candidatus Hydrogenedentota bacterium]
MSHTVQSKKRLLGWMAHALVMGAVVFLATACSAPESELVPAEESDDATVVPEPIAELDRPNVVWILIDTLRSDHVGAYGYERDTTPHIDALAERGVLFERHFAQAPNTLLSVPSYMSGRYYPVDLQDGFHFDQWFMKVPPEEEKLAPELFRENGYVTGMFSASHWYGKSSRLGKSFDHFGAIKTAKLMTSRDYREENPELYEWFEEKKDERFFAYIHTLDAHEPRFGFNTAITWLDPYFPRKRDLELRFWAGLPSTRPIRSIF